MLSQRFGRPMVGIEKLFVNQIHNCYIQFALEVEHREDMPTVLNKVKNAIAGLYIKSDGFNLLDNLKDQESVTVHEIPKEIETLSACCDWIYNTYTPNIESSLASIAADDHRIVVNSNHSITDGGYFVNLLKDIQDPSKESLFSQKAPIPKDLRTDLLKNEFDNFLKNKTKYMKNLPSYQQKDLTYLNLQETVSLPDSYNLLPKRCKAELKCTELSPFIYDRQTKRLSHMSEFLWTGLCMAINAKNGQYGPIGLENCMDLRRLLPKERVNQSFGNAYTDFTMSVKEANPRMTINEINSSFRSNFNRMKVNDWFYKEYMFPFAFQRENCSVSHVSNVGPMKFRSPYKDFYLQCTQKEEGLRPILQVTSYSKNNEEKDINDIVLHMRYSPTVMSKKNANDIFDTYVYFLKNVDPRKKSGDVLDELIAFQNSL
ncbi:hypothetical protein M9Y10_000272 [Tritrichomonas musculus]|uniref:Condensation domain-containing protein n=1 Tax=Tritrichomonas musculus TaxID=1915356 RepID=A0ABR2L5J2_9EUKA